MLNWKVLKHISGFLREIEPHDTYVSEKVIDNIHSVSSFIAKADTDSVQYKDDKIMLISDNNEGSLVNFNEKININNFAISIDIDNIIHHDHRKSGIYLWVTESKLTRGTLKGASNKFNGIMAGIEFAYNRINTVFTYNFGIDYTNREKHVIHDDNLNMKKLNDVKKITFKMIHTEKNLKLEVYGDDKLVSDTFKIFDPNYLKMDFNAYNLGITTVYEHPSESLTIKASNLLISERNESDQYHPVDLHTPLNDFIKTKSDDEIRLALANASHFINYLAAAFGVSDKSTIQSLVVKSIDSAKIAKDKVEEFVSSVAKNRKLSIKNNDNGINDKLKALEFDLNNINMRMMLLKKKIATITPSETDNTLLIIMASVIGVMSLIKVISFIISKKKSEIKKE
ncbi:hypothetical protein A0H76_1201 [Hepatospora eriocheir]|uniref:L-type lectin-like domain-containing protein n=1 Tax=Hepatospora eriocheir TaxID=1081669 RepID=A0A1X0QHT0_9MICR|nr:hypothetical protein A0H76_1201 [Hepatospora eriocheir]